MIAVGLWVDTDHVCHVRAFDIGAVEHLLTDIVKFVGKNASLDPQGIVGLFPDDSVGDLSEPPDACVGSFLPFLYHWLRTANSVKLISTQINKQYRVPKKS